MGAKINSNKLGTTLFGKTRRAVLALLYGRPDESFYLRQIARITGAGMGVLQRELNQLSASGIIARDEFGKRAFFKANPKCPIYEELKNIVTKTFGAADILREALSSLENEILVAFIFGSMAGGDPHQDSDVDVMVIGDLSFADVVAALTPAQDKMSREINPSVYPPAELKAKISEGQHFVSSVLNSSKIFLIGSQNELDKLAR